MKRALRVAITNPTCWPHVRRGSERLVHELSHYLAGRGHDVTVISTSPEGAREEQDGPVRRVLFAQRDLLPVRTRWCNFFHGFAFQVRDALLTGGYDAVHCLNYHDAWGAVLARRRLSRQGTAVPRLVYQMAGIAIRGYFRRIPHDGWMFRSVLKHADAVLSVSRFAQASLLREFATPSLLLPSPTDLAPLLAMAKPAWDGRLRILFAADANEPRKGALLLARAFAQVHAVRPDATLAYSGHADAAIIASIRAAVPPEVAASISFLGVGAVGDLAASYAQAGVFVNPALWEAQGMALVEALAAGTPVVGCDHGGVSDIISDPRTGILFGPGGLGRGAGDETALAAAIQQAAALAALPETSARCRNRAAAFGWDRLGARYEAVLQGSPMPACTPTDECRMDGAANALSGTG